MRRKRRNNYLWKKWLMDNMFKDKQTKKKWNVAFSTSRNTEPQHFWWTLHWLVFCCIYPLCSLTHLLCHSMTYDPAPAACRPSTEATFTCAAEPETFKDTITRLTARNSKRCKMQLPQTLRPRFTNALCLFDIKTTTTKNHSCIYKYRYQHWYRYWIDTSPIASILCFYSLSSTELS